MFFEISKNENALKASLHTIAILFMGFLIIKTIATSSRSTYIQEEHDTNDMG